MESTTALVLAGKIETTWSTYAWPSAKGRTWAEALEDIDEGAAGTAFARLRKSHPKEPTIAEFLGAVASIRTLDHRDRIICADCAGGWVAGDDIVIESENREGIAGDPRVYSAVKPCACAEGDQRRGSAAWQEHNAR